MYWCGYSEDHDVPPAVRAVGRPGRRGEASAQCAAGGSTRPGQLGGAQRVSVPA